MSSSVSPAAPRTYSIISRVTPAAFLIRESRSLEIAQTSFPFFRTAADPSWPKFSPRMFCTIWFARSEGILTRLFCLGQTGGGRGGDFEVRLACAARRNLKLLGAVVPGLGKLLSFGRLLVGAASRGADRNGMVADRRAGPIRLDHAEHEPAVLIRAADRT